MADEEEGQEAQEDQEVQDLKTRLTAIEAEQVEAQAEVKRLVTENKKYRERAQAAEFAGLKAKFPALEPDDIAGLNVEAIEKLLSKVAPPQTQEETTENAPSPEVEAAKSFAAGVGGQAPAPGKTYTAAEIRDIGIRDQAEALRLIQEGRMQSPS